MAKTESLQWLIPDSDLFQIVFIQCEKHRQVDVLFVEHIHILRKSELRQESAEIGVRIGRRRHSVQDCRRLLGAINKLSTNTATVTGFVIVYRRFQMGTMGRLRLGRLKRTAVEVGERAVRGVMTTLDGQSSGVSESVIVFFIVVIINHSANDISRDTGHVRVQNPLDAAADFNI